MNYKNKVNFGISYLGLVLIFAGLILPSYVYPGVSFDEFKLKVVLRSVILFYLLIKLLSIRNSFNFPKTFQFYALYFFCFIAVFSTVYSVDPLYSLIRSLDLLIFIFVAAFISASNKNFQSSVFTVELILVLYLLIFFVISLLLGQPIYRSMGLDGVERLGGFIVNPNLLAYCCLMILLTNFYFYFSHMRSSKSFYTYMILLIFAIFLTYSRSVLLLTLISIFLFMFFFSKKNIKFIWIAVFIFVPVLMIFTQDWIVSFLERGHGTENLTSMGGRLDVWSSLINFNNMTYEIIYGYGYQMLFSSGISSEQAEYGITMAHNNFIQSFLGLGLLGFIPFCIFWIRNIYWTSKQFFISNRSPKSVFLFITSISIFVYSSVEFGIAGPSNIITPVFFIILFAANKKYKSIL